MMKNIDKSSPFLMKAVATGESFPDGLISFTQQDSTGRLLDYYTIALQNVFVTELSQSDASDPNKVFEKLVLKAQAFEFKYTPITVKGAVGTPVSFKWDCAENKGG
jgi:type VI secretion system Hcp family effector